MIHPSPLRNDILVNRELISSSGSRLANDLADHDLPPSLVCKNVPLLPTIHPFCGFSGSKSMSKRMGDSVAIGSSTCSQVFSLFALTASGSAPAAIPAPAAQPCISSRRLHAPSASTDITTLRSAVDRAPGAEAGSCAMKPAAAAAQRQQQVAQRRAIGEEVQPTTRGY